MEVVVLGLLSCQLSLRSVFWDVWNRATNSWCWHWMKRSGSSVMKCWSERSPWKPWKLWKSTLFWYTKLLSLNAFNPAFAQNEGQEKEFQKVVHGWWFYTKALSLKKTPTSNHKTPWTSLCSWNQQHHMEPTLVKNEILENSINIPSVGHKYCMK